MKLAISNIAWDKENDNVVYELMLRYGFSGLEIAPSRTFPNLFSTAQNEKQNFIVELKKYGILPVAMQSLLYGRNDLKLFSDTQSELLNYLVELIDFGASLGIKSLIFGSPKNRKYEGISKEEAIKQGIDFFRKIGDFAKSKDVYLCIEPNPEIYGGNFMCTTEETLEFVKLIDNDGIKLHLDLGTVVENNESIKVVEKSLPYISHFHISEPYLEPIIERNIHKEIYEIIKDFDVYCSIEMKSTTIENIEKILVYISTIFNN